MKVLMAGYGNASWEIRGAQIAPLIGADVIKHPSDVFNYDVLIVVKNVSDKRIIDHACARNIPIVWDVVDNWPQLERRGSGIDGGSVWSREESLAWIKRLMKTIRPSAFVVNTSMMENDFAIFNLPVLNLPHHSKPGITRNPIRRNVRKVGYEGGLPVIGKWLSIVQQECTKRGWEFVVDAGRSGESAFKYADVDIGIGLRHDVNGYMSTNWKPVVKLANMHASGTPCILSPTKSLEELAVGGEVWVSTAQELSDAFDMLQSYDTRLAISNQLVTGTITIDDIAKKYKQWLQVIFS